MKIKDSWIIGAFSIIAVLGMLAIAWQFRERTFTGFNDFIQLYSGARLVGTPGLYDAGRVSEVQKEAVGVTSDSWRYTRLPYYAAFLWPLGKLPYQSAYLVWELLSIAAFAGFVVLWGRGAVSTTVLFSSLSLPAFTSLMNGQDSTFLLLWIALGLYCRQRGQPFLAGVVFSLCASKYHLFLLLPLLIWGRKDWRLGGGLLAGGGTLLAISFAAAGPSWPWQYYSVLLDPRVHPSVRHMPNLHGLFSGWPEARWVEWAVSLAVVGAAWVIARRASFEYALAAALVGGLLVSYHAYLPDCSLLLPAALAIASTTTLPSLKLLAVLFLCPVTYVLLLIDSAVTVAVPAAILAMLALMFAEVWRYPSVATAVRPCEQRP